MKNVKIQTYASATLAAASAIAAAGLFLMSPAARDITRPRPWRNRRQTGHELVPRGDRWTYGRRRAE